MEQIRKAFKVYPVRTLLALCVVVLLYYGLFVYPVWAFHQYVVSLPLAVVFALSLFPILGRLSYEWRPGRTSRWIAASAMLWSGACFVLVCTLLLVNGIAWLVGVERPELQYVIALAIATIVSAFAWFNAQWVYTNRIPITTEKLQAPLRIVQISDVHIGSRGIGFLERVVKATNEQQPDLVLITGDLVDMDGVAESELVALSQIQAPCYYIIGNHERYIDLEDVLHHIEAQGIHILRNETATWGPLQLLGIDDAESKRQVKRVLPSLSLDPERFRLLMYHRPDGFEFAASTGIDLMLCGHTHNGQIIPFNFLVKRAFPRIQGLYHHGHGRLYVSPGTGTWGPTMRLGSRNEITVLELQPA